MQKKKSLQHQFVCFSNAKLPANAKIRHFSLNLHYKSKNYVVNVISISFSCYSSAKPKLGHWFFALLRFKACWKKQQQGFASFTIGFNMNILQIPQYICREDIFVLLQKNIDAKKRHTCVMRLNFIYSKQIFSLQYQFACYSNAKLPANAKIRPFSLKLPCKSKNNVVNVISLSFSCYSSTKPKLGHWFFALLRFKACWKKTTTSFCEFDNRF